MIVLGILAGLGFLHVFPLTETKVKKTEENPEGVILKDYIDEL